MNQPITYAYIETTNFCNLQCSFCNRDEVIGALQHMPLSKYRKMLDNLKHHPIKEAKLMGMGEPMLHPQFDEVCKIFKEYFPDAFLIVATNCQYNIGKGRPLGKRFQNALKYIDLLYFSIDGYDKSYERDRSPAKWSRLLSFLSDFKEVDRKGCRVTCNYVVNPENVTDIQRVSDEIVDGYGLEELRLNIAQDWSEDRTLSGGYTTDQIEYLNKYWKDNIKGKSEWDFPDCFWVKEGIYTTVEGHVKMCCLNTGAKPFGNLFDNSIEEIRETKDYKAVQQGCATGKPTSHCINCSYKELAPLLSEITK